LQGQSIPGLVIGWPIGEARISTQLRRCGRRWAMAEAVLAQRNKQL